MLRTFSFCGGILGTFTLLFMGCTTSTHDNSSATTKTESHESPASANTTAVLGSKANSVEEHGHKAGAHGGIIVSLGRNSYHVEAIVTSTGELRLHTLGSDESRIVDIEAQELIAYVKVGGASDSITIDVKPQSQPGDAKGKASLFVAQLPDGLIGKTIDVTVPNITIGGERFRLGFTNKSEAHDSDEMPSKVADEEEKKLYLSPGGIYTLADIQANGNLTASQKYSGFQATHDLKPKVGDKICPVTLTKANPKCTWIVGGKTYEFCCPPCVDEFVTLAKTKPEDVKQPDQYIKRNADPVSDLK